MHPSTVLYVCCVASLSRLRGIQQSSGAHSSTHATHYRWVMPTHVVSVHCTLTCLVDDVMRCVLLWDIMLVALGDQAGADFILQTLKRKKILHSNHESPACYTILPHVHTY